MTQAFRAGMIGAARLVHAGRAGEAATVVRRGLRDDAAPPVRTVPPGGLFGGMMSDMQDAFDSLYAFNPFTPPVPPAVRRALGRLIEASFTGPDGTRPYKLYVPACAEVGTALPLVVMLHGCSQSPDDFAAGTRMNDWAERDGFLVCYPGQISAANGQKCWNWFSDKDQHRGQGEPALVAGITRDVMARHAVDPARVYVAGLSAGGALAATMGQAYPDLYAAVGVHSGLACGAAHDMSSAFAAMRQGAPAARSAATIAVPTIVFHGDRDSTVHPLNGDAVATQAIQAATVRQEVEDGRVPDGHRYRRTRFLDAAGQALVEQWTIHGAGHAWAGGDPSASYTDAQGPDASGEMLRFFAEHVGPVARRFA